MRGVLALLGRTVAWLIILGATAVVLAAVVVPRLSGATPYTVMTGSMSPALPPGTLVVMRPASIGDLAVGDVVTAQLESGEPAVVTHRISSIAYELDGDLTFETKGDANAAPDRALRLPAQIRGELWYALPLVGYVSTALTGGERQWIVTVVAIVLIGYAAWMFLGAWRARGNRQPLPTPDGEGGAST
jgi:signal peptidase I